ncbi:type II secretion system protein GspM [Thauera aromatica]|uniref:type II secretion system protein GspM n=1 Tax=Thauera aromatica TaxID=59405 RepID=UPI001FFD4AFB|nr:type II secretion system protein GspM [Thauera aromatica]MCK2094559.1 type II secretion system protein M [Thauera aromatica]
MSAQQRPGRFQLPVVWTQRADGLRQQFGNWWLQHPPHERRLMAIGAVVVGVALLWLVGIQPALRTLDEAREQLPRLRAETAQLQAIVHEARGLQRGRVGNIDLAQVPEALRASLRRAGLESASVFERGSGRWEIVVESASAASVMDWLAGMPLLLQLQTQALDLTRTNVDGRDRPGHVSGRITLVRQEAVR